MERLRGETTAQSVPPSTASKNTVSPTTVSPTNDPAIYRITADEILAAVQSNERANRTPENVIPQQLSPQPKPKPQIQKISAAKLAAQEAKQLLEKRQRQVASRPQINTQHLPTPETQLTARSASAAYTIAASPAARMDRIYSERAQQSADFAPVTQHSESEVLDKPASRPNIQSAASNMPTQPASLQTANLQSSTKGTKRFFGIQIMQSAELSYLKDALRRLSLEPKQINIIRQRGPNNRIQYVAIYGQFQTEADAQKTLDELPEDALSEGAFIRKVAIKTGAS